MKLLLAPVCLLLTAHLLYGQQTSFFSSQNHLAIQQTPSPSLSDDDLRGRSISPVSKRLTAIPQDIDSSFNQSSPPAHASLSNRKSLTNLFATKNTTKTKIATIRSVDK
ncbi:MAG: hypothetical protein ACRBG0_09700 [Lewinella sp.]|uniref:hypothetical protein n=1 Tax=Lewinella sp. TaxID=2004506 RepID=UPI003D6AEBF6